MNYFNKTNQYNKVLCNNCGKHGHQFHQCKSPITSYGIIIFRKHPMNNKNIQYLMIRRKHSYGYIDFIRGKYTYQNTTHLKHLIDEMSLSEKNYITTKKFEELCSDICGKNQWKNEENGSMKKFGELNEIGIEINGSISKLEDIVRNSETSWNETEWEFPKGRRNSHEKEIDCAIREFTEETGCNRSKINIMRNIIPFEEIFIGTNHKSYKHKYYLAYMDCSEDECFENYQKSEVSKISWKTLSECLNDIRPYNTEKKKNNCVNT